MARDSNEDMNYRDDTRDYLEFCQETRVGAPLSVRCLNLWLDHLAKSQLSEEERARKRSSVEILFRHMGLLPESDAT